MNTLKLRYRALFEKDLLNDLDNFCEEYEQLLPHFEELAYMYMDEVPDFGDPGAWVLQNCMRTLLFDEKCDPNI
jgi:hypothetical protein